MTTEIAPIRATGELTQEPDLRAQRAYEKRLGGFSWDAVSEEIGYANADDAYHSVKAYLQRSAMRMSERTRKEALDKELDRLDVLQSACWDMALKGDLKAIETSVRIINSRAKLLGLELIHQATPTQQTTILVSGPKEEFVEKLRSISSVATKDQR